MMMRNFYSNDHSDAVDVFGRIHAITRRKYANTEIQNTKSPSASGLDGKYQLSGAIISETVHGAP